LRALFLKSYTSEDIHCAIAGGIDKTTSLFIKVEVHKAQAIPIDAKG
jgi:hypothetical protein